MGTPWFDNEHPKHISVPAHGVSVITCLLISDDRIISAADDHSIQIYSAINADLLNTLNGHEGGVWSLVATKDTLVSGSTDRTVRIWDIQTGRCTHVFGGHTSTVRSLAVVEPATADSSREELPQRPLIVSGSRDHSLRVWDLPMHGEPEYHCWTDEDDEKSPPDEVDQNPYHKLHLEGHEHAVRAVAAKGRTAVSGSYDTTVRVWDIITGKCVWVLEGHSEKVYSVELDPARNQAYSGSMDSTVRVWDLEKGQCKHVLTGHTSLVGLLGLSPSYLVSASADATMRVWNPDTGELYHELTGHTGAITCCQHDDSKVFSGSDGTLRMWNVKDGTAVRDLLTGIIGVWQVTFDERWCVAASNLKDRTMLDIWDFGGA